MDVCCNYQLLPWYDIQSVFCVLLVFILHTITIIRWSWSSSGCFPWKFWLAVWRQLVATWLVGILQPDWNNTTLNWSHCDHHHGDKLCFHDDHKDISQSEQSAFALLKKATFIRAPRRGDLLNFGLKTLTSEEEKNLLSSSFVTAIPTFIRAPLRQWSQSDWVVIA